jgi:hypothetical protein
VYSTLTKQDYTRSRLVAEEHRQRLQGERDRVGFGVLAGDPEALERAHALDRELARIDESIASFDAHCSVAQPLK